MSNIQKALDTIKLAAAEPGVAGLGEVAERAGVNADVGRRLMKRPTKALSNLMKMEAAAINILGGRGS